MQTTMDGSRRSVLLGLGSLLAAPALVRAGSLMRLAPPQYAYLADPLGAGPWLVRVPLARLEAPCAPGAALTIMRGERCAATPARLREAARRAGRGPWFTGSAYGWSSGPGGVFAYVRRTDLDQPLGPLDPMRAAGGTRYSARGWPSITLHSDTTSRHELTGD